MAGTWRESEVGFFIAMWTCLKNLKTYFLHFSFCNQKCSILVKNKSTVDTADANPEIAGLAIKMF